MIPNGLVSNKPRPIITLTETNLERAQILWELRQVLSRDRLLVAFFLAAPPAANAFTDSFGLAVAVPGAPSRARRPFVAVMPAHAPGDFAQEGLVVGLQGHVSMGLDHCNVVIWAYPPTNRGLNPNARHTRTRSTATRILSQAIPSVPPGWARPICQQER